MSVVFTVELPVEYLPSPLEVLAYTFDLWYPSTESSNVERLSFLHDTVIPVCPTFDEFGGEEWIGCSQWIEDQSYSFYLSNESTRGLEVIYFDNKFRVRLLSLASPLEWEFAFQILECAVGGENALIKTESDELEPQSFRIASIRDVFSEQRIVDILHEQVYHIVITLASEELKSVGLAGPIMEAHIGPWLVSRILSSYEDLDDAMPEVTETVLAILRIVNYIAVQPRFDGYEAAEISKRKIADDKYFMAAAIGPEQGYFVPKVDCLVLPRPRGGLMYLSAEKFKDQLGEYFVEIEELFWVDEYFFALAPVARDRFRDFVRTVEPECTYDAPEPGFSREFLRNISNLCRL